jgi:hypothetical protein
VGKGKRIYPVGYLNVNREKIEVTISEAKITQYLLVLKARNDKSRFLAQAGFTQENPEALRLAIQSQAIDKEAIEEKSNEYGIFIPS